MPGLGRLAIVSRTRLRSSLLGNNYLHRSPDLTLAEQESFVPAQVRCVSGQNEGGETAGLVDSIGGVISLDRWAGILGTTELLGCVLAGMASAERTDPPMPATGYVCLGIASFAFIWLVQARLLRLYTRATLVAGVRENLQRGLLAGVLTVGQLSLLSLLSESAGLVSRDWFVSWGLGVLATVATVRLLWSVFLGRALSRGGCLERAIVLAGSAEAAAELMDLIRQESGGRIGVLFSIAIQDIDDPAAVSLLEHAIRDEKCHRVIIGGFERVPAGLRSLTDRLALVAVDITVIPNLAGFGGSIKRMDRIGSLPAIGVASHPLTPLQAFLKRTEDLVIATVALIVFAPVLVLISIAVKLDSRGPVLFTQHREGFNGRVFELFKFRTMYSDMADPAASRPDIAWRSARDAVRKPLAANEPRRTSATDQRAPWRDVNCRTAATCVGHDHARRSVAGAACDLRGPAPAAARHHGVGAGSQLPRRDQYARKTPEPGLSRLRLHRQMVAGPRFLDHS